MIDRAPALFGDDPIARPLTYPGRIPSRSGVLVDDQYLPLDLSQDGSVERWLVNVDGKTLRLVDHLERLDAEPINSLHAVVAVGSNAAPSQLRRKFLSRSIRAIVPMTIANVKGIFSGVSAHINKAGYVPAAPVECPGEVAQLFVLWLNNEQLHALDATEPNYYRCRLPEDEFAVSLPSGEPIVNCHIYVSKHGCLLDRAGTARRLIDQSALIQNLLDSSSALRKLCGTTPQEFVAAVMDATTRDAAYEIFREENWVRHQPRLLALIEDAT